MTKWYSVKEAPNYEEWILTEWYDGDDEILKGMKANELVSISQYNDIYSNNTIYEGTCEIYKNK